MLLCFRETMSIQFLGNKVFKNRAKVDVWIRTKQSGLNVYLNTSINTKQNTFFQCKYFHFLTLFQVNYGAKITFFQDLKSAFSMIYKNHRNGTHAGQLSAKTT
mgnify:CR=1 FL=1